MDDKAISDLDFAALMLPLGPFEPRPRLAVAVSGGADSLALTLLADKWARMRGGHAVGLTVDHRLRPDAAAEANRVGQWLAVHGIDHVILVREGERPTADIQAVARKARHDLLGRYCAEAGILHLLLAHHREDQAETLLLRLGRGSGVDGLAAMATRRPTRWGQILRPLLDTPRARLRSTLVERGQDWVEDPSNADPVYARVRFRQLAPVLAAEGLASARLAATAARLGRVRATLEHDVARAAARLIVPHPAGFARLAANGFSALSEEIALRVLARLLSLVGGEPLPPRHERLERLAHALAAGSMTGLTLAGCRIVADGRGWIVCREPARVAPPVALVPGAESLWDRRFLARIRSSAPQGLYLGALGASPGRELAQAARRHGIPACARATIPALHDQQGVFAVPHLVYNREGAQQNVCRLEPAPAQSLTVAGLRLVPFGSNPISWGMSSACDPASGAGRAKPGRTQP
ncbi:tRNA lysidine(34) synthetase TilS [Magnetospirillum molischianum]|uniref:tRNA(Ile)-lysidine synthase n=1 Tax=Magnetospirillum molischianum DSM 120 TaxID=1150626 RepID=H8FNF7_MAGML|nr:tRNA lysidine(34) synthetase TilS [Magnetospirillum molischianum]CCG39895.1 tRNA(Ile)-lysidine synthase [Magnetospirillum molischianum DSM 120]